jgi:hypothetical protein
MFLSLRKQLCLGLVCLLAWGSTSSAAIITARSNTNQLYGIAADAGSTLATFVMNNVVGDSGRLLVVTVAGETLNYPTSVTYAGQQMVLGSAITAGPGTSTSVWYLIDPVATTGSIVTAQSNVTTADGGYRVAAMSFGTDGLFLPPTSSNTSSSNVDASISLSVALDDNANPGNPYVAVGSYGANLASGTPTNTGFGTVITAPSNISADGGYYALTGYTIATSGTTTLQVTQNSSRHAFAGLAVSVAAIPEPGTWLMAAIIFPAGCLLRRKNA